MEFTNKVFQCNKALYPERCLLQCDTVCDIVQPIWYSRWTQYAAQKKNTPSPHSQFSTLMNHNQMINKLPPQFQTNKMAPELLVWVCLVRKGTTRQVGPASIWPARHWKLHHQISLRCCQSVYQEIFVLVCLCPRLIGFSGEICGQKLSVLEPYLNNTQRKKNTCMHPHP